jgi:hypothetical protein
MGIGAQVSEDLGKINVKITDVKADIVEIKREFFLERGVHETEIGWTGQSPRQPEQQSQPEYRHDRNLPG